MKILTIQAGVLTNEEVLRHVKSVRHEALTGDHPKEFTRTKTETRDDGTTYERLNGKLKDLNEVTGDVIKHFATDSALAPQAGGSFAPDAYTNAQECLDRAMQQYADHINSPPPRKQHDRMELDNTADKTLVLRLKPYRLTKSEVLMLSNHRPRSEQVLEVLVEEANIRFSAEQQSEMVGIVREVFGLGDAEEEMAEGE